MLRTHENAYLRVCIIRFLLVCKNEKKTKKRKLSYIYRMIILQEIGTEQTFSFIPRSQTYDGLFLRDEQTNTETEVTITSSTQGDYYDTISATFSIKENHFYTIEVRNETTVIHKDRIFCTNQTPVVNYSVNDGAYESQVSDNEFIIYE